MSYLFIDLCQLDEWSVHSNEVERHKMTVDILPPIINMDRTFQYL